MEGDNQEKLIHYLLNAHSFVDSNRLAKHLDVSTKTIYRLVKRINDYYKEPLIISEKGKGYRIDDKEYIEQHEIGQLHQNDLFSPIERRNMMTKDLLLISPKSISIFNIIERYYISESVLNTDEKKIDEMLKRFNLNLERKNRHLFINGDESDIRNALLELIGDGQLSNFSAYNVIDQNEDKDAHFVQEQINKIESYKDMIIPYPYNVNIFSHLYILIMRFRKRGVIKQDKDRKTPELIKLKNEYQSFYRMSDMVIGNIEQYLHTQLPENERIYLFEYLISSRFETQNVQHNQEDMQYSQEVIDITNALIDGASQELNHSFKNIDLEQQLLKHIKPMLNRIEHGLNVRNALIEQIKIEYPHVLTVIRQISDQISETYHIKKMNDDEIGFLTLYFAKELERNPKKIQTLITCTTGIGTSELLKTKIDRNVPEIEIVDVKSSFDLQEDDLHKIDLIISTVHIPEVKQIPIVVISAMFNKNDQIKLRKMIEMLGDNNE
ncbi:BglG family transcription antiterminator [Mammaliicoccus sciuri]|uniref:BglG family transcription antiterminator n=1 Tax=Mammaliicoccus sciuri TaxID=1296 RepID=UPI002B25F719|nr:PRD domain-containing protein [Mammaliicoccus sciuri]WQJ49443.1 PRD domain-containing protein [Mammaliicoccus sciuri]